MKDTDAFLLGRRTYMTHAEAFEPMPPGDPFGDLMNAPRSFLWGGGVGHTVGIPLGAHYAGGRRGALVPSMPVSAAIFGAGVLALRSAVKNGQYAHKNTAIAVVIAAPILQIISSVVFEARGKN